MRTTLGTISVYHTAYNFYTEEHQHLLSLIADHAGQAIESALEYERTRQLALTDHLTGLVERHLARDHDEPSRRADDVGVAAAHRRRDTHRRECVADVAHAAAAAGENHPEQTLQASDNLHPGLSS